MNAKLKYLYLLSCVACMASSCSSEDLPDSAGSDKGMEMTFDVTPLSRGSVTTSFDRFTVYGDMKVEGISNISPSVVFNKTEVVYQDGVWGYEGIKYWFPKHEHSFVAVLPASVLEDENNPQYANSQLSFKYIIPHSEGILSDYHAVSDILAATHRRYYDEKDTNTTTTFRFGHLLSLINISPSFSDNILNDDAYIQFHKLEMTGLRSTASISILPAGRISNTQTDDRVVTVADHEGNFRLVVDFTTPGKIMNHAANVSLFDADDAVIMLPQTFSDNSDAKLILTYSINDEPEKRVISSRLRLQNWESGKSYNYKFTFDRRGLLSGSTAITDWTETDLGNIDVH